MLAKPQGFPRKLGGCAGLDPRLRSAVSAGVGDGERGLRRGLRAPGVGVRPKWVLEYSPSNKRIRYFVSITYVRTGLWTAHKFCGGGKKCFDLTPTELRQRARASEMGTATPARFVVRLAYRPPFDWPGFLNFLSVRATPGVESVKDGVYRRTIRFGSDTGTIGIRQSEQPHTLTLEIEGGFSRELLPIVERVRDLFDLRADPLKIESHLKQSQLLGALLDDRSVPRVPGAWDGFELAVRAIANSGCSSSVSRPTAYAPCAGR